jgi:hypothetical protein
MKVDPELSHSCYSGPAGLIEPLDRGGGKSVTILLQEGIADLIHATTEDLKGPYQVIEAKRACRPIGGAPKYRHYLVQVDGKVATA